MKEFLKENPDRVTELGVQVAGWSDGDAACFFIEDGASYWALWDTHPTMVVKIAEHESLAEFQAYGESQGHFGCANSTEHKFQNFRRKIMGHMQHMELDAELMTQQRWWGQIAGRLWTDKGIISFWGTSADVADHYSEVDAMVHSITGYKIDNTWRFEVLDHEGKLLTWHELMKGRPAQPPKIDKEKLNVQHVNPEVKRELNLPNAGSVTLGNRAAKAGMSGAEFMFRNTIGDSLRSHPDIILENPDSVYKDGREIAHYEAHDAICFVVVAGFPFFAPEGVHSTLLYWMRHADYAKIMDGDRVISVDDMSAADWEKVQDQIWASPAEVRGCTDLCGRLWTDTPEGAVCSFWNTKDDVLKHADGLVRMLQCLGLDLHSIKFEVIENPHELHFFDQLEKVRHTPEVDPEEVKRLQAVQHLDPNAKAALGKEAAGSVRRGAVARKAGFETPAEMTDKVTQSEALLPPAE